MIKFIRNRVAFSMIELILVMVVLGIVASISASLIARVYESYILQRAIHNASISTELATTQVANRLTYAIGGSIIARNPLTAYNNENSIRNIQDLELSTAQVQLFNTLEWIGYDNDSFSANVRPGWSSYCNVEHDSTSAITIVTPGSELDVATDIIASLGAIGRRNGRITDGALIFSGGEYSTGQIYDFRCMGYINNDCISQIERVAGDIITITDNSENDDSRILTDRYQLAWSAYAIVPGFVDDEGDFEIGEVNPDTGTSDLMLYSNYQPWDGDDFLDGDSNLIVRNVTQFKFFGQGPIVRFKICIREEIGLNNEEDSDNLGVCKEKVVIK